MFQACWISFGLGVVTGAALVGGAFLFCALVVVVLVVRRGRREAQQARAHQAMRAAAQRFGGKDTPPAA